MYNEGSISSEIVRLHVYITDFVHKEGLLWQTKTVRPIALWRSLALPQKVEIWSPIFSNSSPGSECCTYLREDFQRCWWRSCGQFWSILQSNNFLNLLEFLVITTIFIPMFWGISRCFIILRFRPSNLQVPTCRCSHVPRTIDWFPRERNPLKSIDHFSWQLSRFTDSN